MAHLRGRADRYSGAIASVTADSSQPIAPSRQGDKFHYYWAARRALALLQHGTELKAITVEGRSETDIAGGAAGDEVIDVAEYWGSENPADAKRIVYAQLKHSTLRTERAWVASGLKDVFAKFAVIYKERRKSGLHENLAFRIVTNRPIASSVRSAMARLIAGKADNVTSTALRTYLKLPKTHVADFLARVDLNDTEANALRQVEQLRRETGTFVAAASTEVMLRLKEEVADLAASTDRRALRREDVLLIFGVFEDDLLPAPNRIDRPEHILERTVYATTLAEIVAGATTHVVHAAGGVGKSSFAVWLDGAVESVDVVLTFDCFGGGSYRELSKARHDHRGLVQIANELAGARLSDPLIPDRSADTADYLKAFMSRLAAAATAVGASGGRLLLVVDAADNAVMASEADPGSRAFPILLLREKLPENVRLIATARTERLHKLELVSTVQKHELIGFDQLETKAFLEQTYPTVTDLQADEFRALSWGNPRVQTTAIQGAATLADAITQVSDLGLTDAATAFDALLADGLAKLKDEHGDDAAKIDAVCEVLACLRPVILVDTLADLADVTPAFIESLLSDFPAPLRKVGDAVTFRDEPTETYFREYLKPGPARLEHLIARIEPLTASNYYLASSLPQLLWEIGRYDQLIALALGATALPASSETEARQVEEARARFALRAALSARKWVDSARLALRIGRLGEASQVRDRLIADNPDLAGRTLDPDFIDRITGNRYLALGEPGRNLAREGVMLAMRAETAALAPSRLRSAHGWMVAATSQKQHQITLADFADLVLGVAYTQGARSAAEFMSRFTARYVFPIARIVARRLIDAGRAELVAEFGASKGNRSVALACAQELWATDLPVDDALGATLAAVLRNSRGAGFGVSDRDDEDLELRVAVSAVCLALPHGLAASTARRLLQTRIANARMTYLGDFGIRDRHIVALAHALLRRLSGEQLAPEDLAHTELRDKLKFDHTSDREVHDYRANVVPAIPWMNEWARAIVEPTGFEITPDLVAQLIKPGASSRDTRVLAAWILRSATGLARHDSRVRDHLFTWAEKTQNVLSSADLVRAARSLSRNGETTPTALDLFSLLEVRMKSGLDGAEYRAKSFATMARAAWSLDEDRARVYYLEALDSADLVGDQAHTQWRAILELTELVVAEPTAAAARITPLVHIAEGLRATQVADVDFERVVAAIGRVSVEAALKVASQWRDRGTTPVETTLTGVFHHESAPLHDRWAARLALQPLLERGSIGQLALRAAKGRDDADAIYDYAVALMSRNGRHPGNDPDLRKLAKKLGHTLETQTTASLESASRSVSSSWDQPDNKDERDRRHDQVLASIRAGKLNSPAEIAAALESATWENGLNRSDILDIPFEPDRRHDLAAFTTAVAQVNDLGVYDARGVLGRLAATELSVSAARAARDFARSLAVRFAEQISTSSYDPIGLSTLATLAGRPESDILSDALHTIAELDPDLGVDDAYALATNLASVVEAADAAEILDDALQQFDAIVAAAATETPAMAITVGDMTDAQAVAAFVWATLADPATAIRWRATHAARGVVATGTDELVRELAACAASGDPGEFVDPDLHFYLRDADHHLLLALAADLESTPPARLALFVDFLSRVNSREQHLLLSPLSAELLLHIGAAVPQPWAPLAAIEIPWKARKRHGGTKYRERKTPYKFDWDFRENVLESLADSMDLSHKKVERLTSDIITKTWKLATRGAVAEDLRHSRGMFRDRDTYDRYAAPPVFDFDYHLSFHAAMVAAADLAQEHPAILEEEASTDDLTGWARRFRVSPPPDGWRSDHRVAAPARAGLSSGPADPFSWRWAVRADSFLPYVVDDDEWVNIWGRYSAAEHSRDETVKISTILVDRDPAPALVRALQLSSTSYDFHIPSEQRQDPFDDMDEPAGSRPSASQFTLRPWVRLEDRERTLDWGDTFGTELPTPPPRPGQEVQPSLALANRSPAEQWTDESGNTAFVGEAWTSGPESGGSSYSGSRLRVRMDWLDSHLKSARKSLVAVVNIDRDLRGYERDRHRLDEMEYLSDYFRVFEYHPDTGWRDHRGRPQTG